VPKPLAVLLICAGLALTVRLALGSEPPKPTPTTAPTPAPSVTGTSATPGAPPLDLPTLTPADLAAIDELFENLATCFKNGDIKSARLLFADLKPGEEERRKEVLENLHKEMRSEDYTEFVKLEPAEPEEKLQDGRFSVWVRLRFKVGKHGSSGDPPWTNYNNTFVLERAASGEMRFVDSQFFDYIGKRQGLGLVADALLLAIGILAALSFWVWMGYEAFARRPRTPGWRTAVTLIPVAGALGYFAVVFVPGLFRAAPPEPPKGATGILPAQTGLSK